ncbi:MAG: DNA topoisomerase, partial [Clostridia bacterium]
YDLVVKRFLAVLMPDFEYEQTTVYAEIAGETFYARGKIVKSRGWKSVYDAMGFVEDDSDTDADVREQALPNLPQGGTLPVSALKLGVGKTAPPKRHTEATLLSAMEHPEKYISDSSLVSVLDQAGGIGTPATRADIIEKLFSSSYIERRGKEIFPLSKGIQVIELVPPDLKSAELTARWEERLAAISRGAEPATRFIAEMKKYAAKLVSDVISADGVYRHDNMTRERCPICDKFLLEVNGKHGKRLVCQDRECGYKQNLTYLSNARCPTCHKKLEVFGDGDKKVYVCKCGWREKFDKFNERLRENRNNMSRHEVSNYMQKQQDDKASETSAFAAAWEKAMKGDK